MDKFKQFFSSRKPALIGIFLIFILDINLPIGIAVGVLYMGCFVMLKGAEKNLIITMAAISICFIIIKLLLFPVNQLTTIILINRSLSILAVIFSAIWAMRHKKITALRRDEYLSYVNDLNIKDEKIKLTELYFYNLMEYMLEGVQLIGHDYRYLYVNKEVEKQSGYKKEELLGYSMSYKFPGIERTDLMKAINRSMTEKVSDRFLNEFVYPNGKVGYFELFMHPVDEGLFILSIDVTDRVDHEKLRKQYTEKLEQMLHITSHKVRAPVANLIGLVNQVITMNPENEELRHHYNYMKISCLRLEVFIKELNDFLTEAKTPQPA